MSQLYSNFPLQTMLSIEYRWSITKQGSQGPEGSLRQIPCLPS